MKIHAFITQNGVVEVRNEDVDLLSSFSNNNVIIDIQNDSSIEVKKIMEVQSLEYDVVDLFLSTIGTVSKEGKLGKKILELT